MASLNKVILIGNLTKDPELKFIPSGSAVCNFRMATNRKWKSQSGELKEEACFVSVVAWGKQGEAIAEYLKKGSPILIEGRLQSRSWETEDGQKRSILEVISERAQFLGGGRGSSSTGGGGSSETRPSGSGSTEDAFIAPGPGEQSQSNDEDIPF